jgi:hypothetical protein
MYNPGFGGFRPYLAAGWGYPYYGGYGYGNPYCGFGYGGYGYGGRYGYPYY